jgi:hypothetical protein
MDGNLTYNDSVHGDQKVVPLLASAGDAALFASDVWHRRLPCLQADAGRFFLQVHYGRRDLAQRIRDTTTINQCSSEAISRAQSTREKNSSAYIDPASMIVSSYDGQAEIDDSQPANYHANAQM